MSKVGYRRKPMIGGREMRVRTSRKWPSTGFLVQICHLVWLVTWSHRHRVADSAAATPTFRSSFHLSQTTSALPLSSPSHPSLIHSPFSTLPLPHSKTASSHNTYNSPCPPKEILCGLSSAKRRKQTYRSLLHFLKPTLLPPSHSTASSRN